MPANCAICHVTSGGGNSLLDLDYSTPLARTLTYDVPPQHETFGIKEARLIAPGQPDLSVLYHRITMRGQGQMPPLATSHVDPQAKELLKEWIAGLTPATLEARPAESPEPAQP